MAKAQEQVHRERLTYMTLVGVSGLAEVIGAASEALTWSAQAARMRSGS